METFDPYGIPTEICQPSHPLIGLTGLDIENKPTHRLVWEAFTYCRQSDRIPLRFKLFNPPVEFPLLKPKRQSYEWYIPKGILKTNWVTKYLEKIPSLLVLFVDLDWNDSEWNDKKGDIAVKIQTLRSAIGGRNIRLAVVLLQSPASFSLPAGEDNTAAEKAATLCSTCEFPPKHLFVLPHTDAHLLSYTIRLENALSEISGGFYLGECKIVKAHRDFLNKTNHQLLFIRHQFKLGFYNQLRGDPHTAIKHYAACYHNLLELRFTNTNLHEIRIVAAIVNYKICKLDFVLNLPRDAIEQFRRHIDVFRQRTGPKELIFEHYAWLSKQYHLFGEIFEDAVVDGLPAVQTQHPGFYYQQAALYAVQRRETAHQVCKDCTASPELLNGWEMLEFYGQRPWRPGKHSLEPPEIQSEAQGVEAICFDELHKVKHSALTIPLFSAAITQFKKYRCPRIKRFLMVHLAKEYMHSTDFSKALLLMGHVMIDYRIERWWPLLTSCASETLKYAYQTTSHKEYVALCLEIAGPNIALPQCEKERVFKNLLKVIMHDPPDPEPGFSDEQVREASDKWSNVLQNKQPITIDMDAILSCLQLQVSFLSKKAPIDQDIVVVVKIRNNYHEELSLYSVNVETSSSCSLHSNYPSPILLSPSEIVELTLSFHPKIEDLMSLIKIKGLTAHIGLSLEHLVGLHWSGGGSEGFSSRESLAKKFKIIGDTFDDPPPNLEVEVECRKPLLGIEIENDATSMVWEWLPIQINLQNGEASEASDVTALLSLEEGADASLERTTQITDSSGLENKVISSKVCHQTLGSLGSGGKTTTTLYIKVLTAAARTFSLKVKYSCKILLGGREVVCPCISIKKFAIKAVIPFQITVETQSMKFEPFSIVARKERFLVVPQIKCCSHVPITFVDSSLVLANGVSAEGENSSQIVGMELVDQEEGRDCFCLSLQEKSETPVSLGRYLLYWKRSNVSSPSVSVSVGLPTVGVEDYGLWIDTEIPPQGAVRTPMTIAYQLTNTSLHLSEIVITMHVSDAFMFAGHKELRMRILPGWKETITYTIFPLKAGFVQLPKLCITYDPPSSSSIDAFLSRMLPSHIFVMPQEKKKGEISNLQEKLQNITLC